MANIYDINERFLQFQRFVEEAGEELDEQTIRDTFESLEGEVSEKLTGYAAVIKNMESDVDGMKKAEKAIQERRKFAENKIQRLTNVVDETMKFHEIDKIPTPEFVIGYRKCPPSLEVVDEDEIPEQFWIPQDPKLDRSAALTLLKEGATVEGCRLVTDKKNFYIK